MASLPGRIGSCWRASAASPGYPTLEGTHHADTLVVGGGIVGLTTALQLANEGRDVVLLEGMEIGGQVTGGSSAKITTQHQLVYRHLIDTKGKDLARTYADANAAGCDQIGSWIDRYGIECEFEEKDAWVYTTDAAHRADIEAEGDAAHTVGLEAEVHDRAPLPFGTEAALRFPRQAQFNPTKYLLGLAATYTAKGGRLFENSRARLIEDASRWRAVTDHGTIHAENIVVATNLTVKSPLGMSKRTQPRCHTALTFKIADEAMIDGMFISVEANGHSLRTGRGPDGPLLLALGPHFDTGRDGDVAARFRTLEEWVRANFDVGDVAWRWCNEDYDTADRVPFIGEPDPEKAPGFYIATGFNAWGISNGTAGGMMMADMICGRESPWKELFDPARPSPDDFHESGSTQSIVAGFDAIEPGSGGVVEQGEEKIAAWRDTSGTLHKFSAACTHKGCPLTWNNADNTWDCPCHGSVFAADGAVLHGPARVPMKPVGDS